MRKFSMLQLLEAYIQVCNTWEREGASSDLLDMLESGFADLQDALNGDLAPANGNLAPATSQDWVGGTLLGYPVVPMDTHGRTDKMPPCSDLSPVSYIILPEVGFVEVLGHPGPESGQGSEGGEA